MMITDSEQRLIEKVIIAFTIISVDMRRAGDTETITQLTEVIRKWTTTHSIDFRAVFAEAARELGVLAGKGNRP